VTESPRASFPWSIAGVLCCAYAVAFMDRALVGVAGAPIKHDLGLSDSQFGLLHGTAFAALFCICGVPLGWVADRVDRRAMIAAGLVFWTVMTAVCGLTHSFGVFFAARVGVGLGEACLVPAGMSLLGSVTPRDRMARATAVFLMGAAIGSGIALLAGGFLLGRLSLVGSPVLPLVGAIAPWQAVFLLACLPGLAVAALVMTIREPPREVRATAPREALRAAMRHLLANRGAYGYLTAATACNIASAQAQAAWMPLYFVRHFGLPAGDAALVMGLMYLMSAPVGQWAGGVLTDWLQARGATAPQNTALALCAGVSLPLGAIFRDTDNIGVCATAYVLFNFLIYAGTPTGLTGWQLLTPERYRGLTIAILVSVVTMVGVGLGPAIVGLLTDDVFRDEQALGRALTVVFLTTGAATCLLALAGRRSFARSARRRDLRASLVTARDGAGPATGCESMR
jgi:MFS family permease